MPREHCDGIRGTSPLSPRAPPPATVCGKAAQHMLLMPALSETYPAVWMGSPQFTTEAVMGTTRSRHGE
jgi:hypothetical protein